MTPLVPIQQSLQVGAFPINSVGVFIILFTKHLYTPGAGGELSEFEDEGQSLKGLYTLFTDMYSDFIF